MQNPITATLGSKQRQGIKYPTIHVLMPDGRVTEFKETVVVVPEGKDADGELDVFSLLINRRGEPYFTPDGSLAVLPCLPFALGVIPDPNKVLRLEDIVTRSGLSLSTVKRAVGQGELKGKIKIGKRAVGFRAEDVETWLSTTPVKVV